VKTATEKVGADGVLHRVRMAGIYCCGAKERDGARGVTMNRLVTCPACLGLISGRQAAAKARAPR
jgi:hypothetical protein